MTGPRSPVLGEPVPGTPVPDLVVPEKAEDPEGIYGWCGLCHLFTEFPHECCGNDGPARTDLSSMA
jgi:hypothetical protein